MPRLSAQIRRYKSVLAPLLVGGAGALGLALGVLAVAQTPAPGAAPAPGVAAAAAAAAATASPLPGQLTVGLTRMPLAVHPGHASQGLIVRLKEAAPHITINPALLPLGDQMRRRDSERWRSVLRGSGLTATSGTREPLMRPSGRDTYVLDFGRLLSAEETERVAARLRARPEVEWVSANALEQRLQVSNDPLAPEQWWLKAVAGLNSNTQADRLRGVPGFFPAWQSGLAGTGTAAAGGSTSAAGAVSAVVAVLDTGITANPELFGRLLPG